MSTTKVFHCIVDDTALITNISEIETWVVRGAVHLVIPLHTLERLHLLKKDTSQIGQNARKAVKFLDDVTSNPESASRIVIQGPDDSYSTWAEVEAHYTDRTVTQQRDPSSEEVAVNAPKDIVYDVESKESSAEVGDTLSQILTQKLVVGKVANGTSPMSTPPLSPSSSGLQSTKTSPEVKNASLIASDVSPVPQTLKPLLNPVVWYTQQHKKESPKENLIFLTNSSDNSYLARDFGVSSKNIHQLRAAIGMEDQEAKNHDKYLKKHGGSSKSLGEPKTLFRYEEESEDEELVFKPRSRGPSRSAGANRGGNTGSVRSRKGHSPANSLSGPPPITATNVNLPANKPQIPVEEIDPDSFDRGSFGRGSTPLTSVGNVPSIPSSPNSHRNSGGRGTSGNHSQPRGGFSRGGRGGSMRGIARGRGRLFVP